MKKGERDIELDDILASDYSYYILLIELIRNITGQDLQKNLESILEGKPVKDDRTLITQKRDNLLRRFMKRLEAYCKQGENEPAQRADIKKFPCINPGVFQKVVEYNQIQARTNLQSYIDEILDRDSSFDKGVFDAAVLDWIIHYDKNEELIDRVQHLVKINPNIFKIDIVSARQTIMEQYETLRIVDDLVIPRDAKSLEGKMKILRVSRIRNGNRMYKTLCIARQVASENKQYMFEVIRDFGNFRLRDINITKCDESLFRVRRVLQTEHCQFTDPQTFESCKFDCKEYKPDYPALICTNCGHLHKQINLYKDLKHLPVLLILQRRGRLGDTFPISFNCMDLRICYRDRVCNTLHINFKATNRGKLLCLGPKVVALIISLLGQFSSWNLISLLKYPCICVGLIHLQSYQP